MEIRILIDRECNLIGYAEIGGSENWIKVEVSEETFKDLKQNMKQFYYKDNELKRKPEKPNKFHFWDSNKEEWVYNNELEISSLEDELGSLELEKYNKNKEIKELKEQGQTFAAKKLEKEVAELENVYQEKLKRYEELEG